MSQEVFVLDGERYLVLERVARWYQVEPELLLEAYSFGLFGVGLRRGDSLAIASVHLDRVATVVRLHVHQGVDIAGIALFLGEAEPD